MTDFLDGQTLTAGHFPVTKGDRQNGSFTFNATTYGVDNDSGTYADCGKAFVASVTGRALLLYKGWFSNSGANFTLMTPVVREGSTVGSGTSFLAASDDNAIGFNNAGQYAFGGDYFLEGLTPLATYNVRLEHRATGGIGTIQRRSVTILGVT